MKKIAPSLLSADFSRLQEEIKEVEQLGVDYLHVDVMDGHFVPNITIGPLVVEAIKPVTNLPLDVHLMIENPDTYIEQFAQAGASIITVHQEACTHLHRTIQHIKKSGVKAGVSLNPATPISTIQHILSEIDLVLIMTVNPGFGGQSFIEEMVPKIETLAEIRNNQHDDFLIEVDGGINEKTAYACARAGADILVAGSAIFGKKDRKQAVHAIRQSIKRVQVQGENE
ncbi:MAG TPA: ribulose-phosphate 3-epimerase [Cerasibacillus sp.]|uniref:ribulose-phosphate 3-epimerase n=1 Tax=Cerasibacillus sp. TaxID=2498711 RepID=UPI002F422F00